MDTYRRYGDDIQLYRTNERSGPAFAKNVGIVNGPKDADILAFLDADDAYTSTFIEEALRYFERYPKLGIVYGDVKEFDESTLTSRRIYKPAFAIEHHLRQDIIGGNFIARRSIVEAVGGFDPSLKVLENYDLTLRMIRHFQAVHIPKTMVGSWISHRCLRRTVPSTEWETSMKKIHAKN